LMPSLICLLRAVVFAAALVPADSTAATAAAASSATTVLVTGATGRTGTHTYLKFKDLGYDVRGLVRNVTKARERLGCHKCDSSEGIFVGDVTVPSSLEEAFSGGVDYVVILTSSSPIQLPNGTWTFPNGSYPVDIDYKGSINQVRQAMDHHVTQVILVSSFGTTIPPDPNSPMSTGHVLFYKLNAEASLMGSGVEFTVVKAAGLVDSPGGRHLLVAGQGDSCMHKGMFTVAREDLADVCVHAVVDSNLTQGLRFDLASNPLKPATSDFKALFLSAQENRI